ncbi:ArgP/LysG family DNA-binding transcriptional regulator [Lysinibacter cavernae]|uniref:LysR family transcriptional regulator (Chromosome initiation inhibitor) n=1 Tax=Lysinibacter cavernae TaxID=1640652 RepID=A0A7X5R2E5_9MICO|nr:LysR family transcriptional regulator (chromosome initiation inhibitor) [Lysinibacter cavernae]
MDFHSDQLRAFAAVIDCGTFELAAQQLNITSSAVSQRIKALESAVGRVLLRRSKPLRPTDSGQVILRLARQTAAIQKDAIQALDPDRAEYTSVAVVINADSLSTWALPALASIPPEARICFDIRREDEAHSTRLLREGNVMAVITSDPEPVQGCVVSLLGKMRYLPLAAPAFAQRWLDGRQLSDALSAAPHLVFDQKDELQGTYLRERHGVVTNPPQHVIPSATDFTRAIVAGLGWGLVPEDLGRAEIANGSLLNFDEAGAVDVPLYWQQWSLSSAPLTVVADAIAATAAKRLR